MKQDRSNRISVNGDRFSRNLALLPFTMRELHRNRRFRRHALGMIATIAVMAYLGPFGTGTRLGPLALVVYWTGAIAINWLLAAVAITYSVKVINKAGKPWWIGIVFGALAAALPGAGIVFVLERLLGRTFLSAGEAVYLYSCVVLVMIVVGFFVSRLIEAPLRSTSRSNEATAAKIEVPFLERLAPRLGRDLLHLHMRDHYVEACTSKGSELILLRFSDALREVDGLDGLQVHRSHWVAATAVAGTVRRGGRTLLRLVNDTEVPVSRTFAPALRERGWV